MRGVVWLTDEQSNKFGWHDWTFVAASGDASAVAMAICTMCGVVRATNVTGMTVEDKIDLRGGCPGRPDRGPTRGRLAPTPE
jgi:hypothetical protein